MKEGVCQSSQRLLTATEKSIESWIETKNLIFCSDYSVRLKSFANLTTSLYIERAPPPGSSEPCESSPVSGQYHTLNVVCIDISSGFAGGTMNRKPKKGN